MLLPRPAKIVLLAVAFGAGCTAPEPEVAVLPDSTLVEVLADLHLAGARAERAGDWAVAWRDSILHRRAVSPEVFSQTLAYYAAHNEAYLKVYDAVLDTLNARRTPYLPPMLTRPESSKTKLSIPSE